MNLHKPKVIHILSGFRLFVSDIFPPAFTASGDGTSNKHVNYDAQHVHYKDLDDGNTHHSCFIGIQSSADQSSETALAEWDEAFAEILEIYNNSPLAIRSHDFTRIVEIWAKMMGMHGDHCSKEKKLARLGSEKKIEAVHEIAGEDEMLDKPSEETDAAFKAARAEMMDKAGGFGAWCKLPEQERALQTAIMFKQALISLGEIKFLSLSEEEQRMVEFFIWCGCGCHKNQNSVDGGNKKMMCWWEKNEVLGPILLANKDNAAVLNSTKSNSNNPAVERALNVTARGGVKAASIAGAIFNNKDDKKGQQDTFRWWFAQHKIPLNFPGTSSNRYGAYCDAAAVLLQHHDKFLEFLEFVRDKKDKHVFTHMEKNLYAALKCNATLTELAVLALYAQAITHPYMRKIRGPGSEDINMLDLGPFHLEVQKHIEGIIADPDLLVSKNATYTTGAMDGKCWESPEAVKAILKIAPELAHLSDVLVTFFQGALETWKCFTSEFTPGGMIDEATDLEKDLAWMPPTNDLNEGLLGSYRVFMRSKTRTTLHQFNAQAMYQRNKTQTFVEKNFNHEDHKYVMQKAREIDASGLEKKRQQKLIQYQQQQVEEKRQKTQKKKNEAAEKATRLEKVKLILDKDIAGSLRGKKLQEQVDAFYLYGAKMPLRKDIHLVEQKKIALQAAIDCFNAGNWIPKIALADGSSSAEEDAEDDDIANLEEDEEE